MGHCRFLEAENTWKVNKTSFNKSVERRSPHIPLTGHDILDELSGVENVFEKDAKGKRRRGERYLVHQRKKKEHLLCTSLLEASSNSS